MPPNRTKSCVCLSCSVQGKGAEACKGLMEAFEACVKSAVEASWDAKDHKCSWVRNMFSVASDGAKKNLMLFQKELKLSQRTVISPRSSLSGSFSIPCIPYCVKTLATGVGAAELLDLPRPHRRCLNDCSDIIANVLRIRSWQDLPPVRQNKYIFI